MSGQAHRFEDGHWIRGLWSPDRWVPTTDEDRRQFREFEAWIERQGGFEEASRKARKALKRMERLNEASNA